MQLLLQVEGNAADGKTFVITSRSPVNGYHIPAASWQMDHRLRKIIQFRLMLGRHRGRIRMSPIAHLNWKLTRKAT